MQFLLRYMLCITICAIHITHPMHHNNNAPCYKNDTIPPKKRCKIYYTPYPTYHNHNNRLHIGSIEYSTKPQTPQNNTRLIQAPPSIIIDESITFHGDTQQTTREPRPEQPLHTICSSSRGDDKTPEHQHTSRETNAKTLPSILTLWRSGKLIFPNEDMKQS